MNFSKTKDIMLEEISKGVRDFHKMDQYKNIDLVSSYIEEREELDRDPVINLDRCNTLMLRSFLDVNDQVKLNQLKDELAHAVIQENYGELEEMFEQEYSNYNDKDYREVYYESS